MDSNQRLHLQKMITTNNVEDNTGLIRQLKHSLVLRENVNNLIMLKAKYMDDPDSLHLEGMSECTFLFTYYTDLYNKIRDIEDGKLDQHEGAYEFGTLLKQIYVDSALKKAEKINAATGETEPEYKGPQVDVSWSQFKKTKLFKKMNKKN